MLAIIRNGIPDTQWHINTPSPTNINAIRFIQADGDELEYIKANFSNIIIPRGRVIKYYGDLAKTIVANLGNM